MDESTNTPPATQGARKSGTKLWLIIGAIGLLLVILSMASGMFARKAAETALERAGIEVDYAGGGETATFTSDEGSMTVGNVAYPDTWPSDAPKYPNGELLMALASNPQTGSAGASVSLTTIDGAAEVVAFYERELKAAGWTIETNANMGGTMALSATKDERTFGMWAVTADGATQVTMGIEL